MIRYAVLLALLWAAPTTGRPLQTKTTQAAPVRVLHADSLQQLCGGPLPIYAAEGELWLEIPDRALRLTAQIDRGAGMRNRPLRCLHPFRMVADPTTGTARITENDSQRSEGFVQSPLPLARIAGSERLLAGIDRCLFESGYWYDCRGGILRRRHPGSETLLAAESIPDGSLLQIGVCYDVEAPARSTEIQMPAGSLPLQISLLLRYAGNETPLPDELVVAANFPQADARALADAVKGYNRSHRKRPLRTIPGGEILPLTTPFGISFDAADERLSVGTSAGDAPHATDWVRIHLGAAGWEREALRHGLYDGGSYRTLRRNLTDPSVRRHACLRDSLAAALTRVFDPASPDAAEPRPGKNPAREFRNARRQLARWDRFMRQDAARLAVPGSERLPGAIQESMLAETKRIYVRLARQSRGTALEKEILAWIARGLIADAQGRFAAPLLRNNVLPLTQREAARRNASVWEAVLDAASAEALGIVPELFRRTLAESGHAAFTMQDAFVGALLKLSAKHPELRSAAEPLATFYARTAAAADPETAIFARIEQRRLAELQTEKH